MSGKSSGLSPSVLWFRTKIAVCPQTLADAAGGILVARHGSSGSDVAGSSPADILFCRCLAVFRQLFWQGIWVQVLDNANAFISIRIISRTYQPTTIEWVSQDA